MLDRLREQVERLPRASGVYLFKDAKGQILYVGKAKELRTRARNYLRDGADGRYHIQFLLQKAASIDYIVTDTEQEALILENNVIKKHRPRYNIFLKDDKTYVHLRLNVNHPFPRLTVVRRPKHDGAQYFGPFVSAGSVRQALRTIGRVFPLRTCTDAELERRKRPCLYYYIKRCSAPCVDLVDGQEYREMVNKMTMFLKGRGNELVKSLRDKMVLQSAERKFERAARTRDQIFAIQATLEKQRISSVKKAERDVFVARSDKDHLVIQTLHVCGGEVSGGESFHFENTLGTDVEHVASFVNQYYQRGAVIPSQVVLEREIPDGGALEAFLQERRKRSVKIVYPRRGQVRKQLEMAVKNAQVALAEGGVSERNQALLEDLQELLSLHNFPRRMECYDVSNIQGTDAVASGVAFIDGEPAKSLYRHYKIRTVKGPDDYAMMREVLERRLAGGLKHGDLPDLLIVDGGRGQLGVALEVMERLGVAAVDALGIAKVRADNHRKVRGQERIHMADLAEPLLLEGNTPSLFLLQRIRDEAHRFAITHHQQRRGKKMGRSRLDDVPGVGPVLKGRLLEHFGSVARVRTASLEDLALVQGVSSELARTLKDVLA